MNLETALVSSDPPASMRPRLPQSAMANWSVNCWHDWIYIAVKKHVQAVSSQEKASAFRPLRVDGDIFSHADIYRLIEVVLGPEKILIFEEGLSKCINRLTFEHGVQYVSYLISLASFTKSIMPLEGFPRLIRSIVEFHNGEHFEKLAEAINLLIFRNQDISLAYEFYNSGRTILASSRSSCITVAAIIASRNSRDFVNVLSDIYPEIFEIETEREIWSFAVDSLIRQVGINAALTAAYFDNTDKTIKLRNAIRKHRISINTVSDFGVEKLDVKSSRVIYDSLELTTSVLPPDLSDQIAKRESQLELTNKYRSLQIGLSAKPASVLEAKNSYKLTRADFSTNRELYIADVDCSDVLEGNMENEHDT